MATSGHQIVATNQTLFSLCGLCALALGAVRTGDAVAVADDVHPGTDSATLNRPPSNT
jgi:hypothetical protein